MKQLCIAGFAVASIAVVDTAWAALAGIQIAVAAKSIILPAFLGVAAALCYAILRRDAATRAAWFAASFAILAVLGPAAGVMSYLVLTLPMPLIHPTLAALDQAMGFDWVAWSDAVAARPWLNFMLTTAYWSHLPTILVALLWLSGASRFDRCAELIWCLIASSILMFPISALFPAVSAPVYFGVPERAQMLELFYGSYLADLIALRDGTMTVIHTGRISGLVSFPLFHVTLTLRQPTPCAARSCSGCRWSLLPYGAAFNPQRRPALSVRRSRRRTSRVDDDRCCTACDEAWNSTAIGRNLSSIGRAGHGVVISGYASVALSG